MITLRTTLLALPMLIAALPSHAAPLNVVASFSILGDMVSVVGGEGVAVTTIVGPDADAHVYEPKPADAAAIAGAGLVVVNGLGFEGWMDRLLDASGYTGAVTVAAVAIAARDTHHDEAHHEEGHEDAHHHDGIDPHAWQDLANGMAYVAAIRDGLCSADAAGCDGYTARAEAYIRELSELDAKVKAEIAAIPAGQRKVITSHDAFGYFGDAYGVTFLSPEGISTEAEPSAAEVGRLIVQIREEGVRALFIENMSDARLISQIARETGVTPGGTLYADALSGPDGDAPGYLAMFTHNAAALIAAMAGK